MVVVQFHVGNRLLTVGDMVATSQIGLVPIIGPRKPDPSVQGPTAPVCGRGGRGSSSSFDDKHGLVVDQGLVAVLSEVLILFYGVIQQCIADVSSRLSLVFAQDRFK